MKKNNFNNIYKSILNVIGNTPLLKINFDTNPQIYAKLEYLNPTFSIKDRTAIYMIEKAEQEGRLKKGGTIIEASSGNQAISASAIAAIKGYKMIITCSSKVSFEKKAAIKAYGAELIECEPQLNFFDGYYKKAKEIYENTPNSIFLNQYFNQENAESHYYGIGKEIWDQVGDKITHCIMVMGSGGTFCGVSKYLKEKNKNIKIIGVDSENSFNATKGNPKPYQLDGMGVDYDSNFLKHERADEIIFINDEESHKMLKTLARKHGLLVGPASGGAALATYNYSKKCKDSDFIVTIFTDSGRAYLSKNYYF